MPILNECPNKTTNNTPINCDLFDVFEHHEDSIVIFDTDWQYIYVNSSGWEALKRRKSDVLGKNVWKLFPHLIDSQFKAAATDSIQHQRHLTIQEYFPHTMSYARVKFYPSKKYLMVQISDITELMHAKQINSQLMGDLQPAMELYWSEENRERREANIGHRTDDENIDEPVKQPA
jgi:PAS domain-containing protein